MVDIRFAHLRRIDIGQSGIRSQPPLGTGTSKDENDRYGLRTQPVNATPSL
jgi:hypothetical protein